MRRPSASGSFMQLSALDPRRLLAIPGVYRLFGVLIGGNQQRRDYVETYVRPPRESRILDFGCGTANILEALPGDCEYVGIDIDAVYIANARHKYRQRPGCQFIQSAITHQTLAGLGKFDIVLANGLMHHLNDVDVASLYALGKTALKNSGRMITVDNCLVPEQSKVAKWLIGLDRGEFIRTRDALTSLMESAFERYRCSIRHDRLGVPYTHIIFECWTGQAADARE